MAEEKKTNYMDMLRAEFVHMAGEKGVEETAAQELNDYLANKVMNSWKNGLKAGMQKRTQPQTVAA